MIVYSSLSKCAVAVREISQVPVHVPWTLRTTADEVLLVGIHDKSGDDGRHLYQVFYISYWKAVSPRKSIAVHRAVRTHIQGDRQDDPGVEQGEQPSRPDICSC